MRPDSASPSGTHPTPARRPAGARSRRSWRRTARGYLLLPHLVPVLVVLGATAGFALLATDGRPGAGPLGRLLLAMLGGQLAIGAVNELADADLDAAAKPSKPIPAGDVSRAGARVVAVGGLVLMVVFGAGFGSQSFALCCLGTGAGLAYDLWLKRTILAWLPYLVALPLLPIWVWTTLRGFEPRLLLLYPLGALAVVGVHLSQALPDAAGDRAAGLRNPISTLGEVRAIRLCWAATLTGPLLALASAPLLGARVAIVAVAAVAVLAAVGLDAALYARRPRLGVRACFPCVAVGTALLGLGWVLAVAR